MKLFDVYPRYNIELSRGQGAWVFDAAGTKYLDLYGGHAVISIGHNHPVFQDAIRRQLEKLAFYSNSIQIPLQQKYASLLGSVSSCGSFDLFLCNSGAEANENALKLASAKTGRNGILAFKKAFHGRTSLAVASTDNPAIKFPVNHHPNVHFAEIGDTKSVLKILEKQDIAAVIIEGIQGVGGIRVPETSFLKWLENACTDTGTILILDEIQSGFGRTGRFFAHQHAGIKPGIISIAKGMGNGFPVAGILISPDFEPRHGLLGTTFGGNHLACAAGIAVLEVLDSENLMANASEMGSFLQNGLSGIPGIKEIRGKGLMIGLEFEEPVAGLRKSLLFEHHIFTGSSSNPNVLRLLPPLCIGKTELQYFLKTLKNMLS